MEKFQFAAAIGDGGVAADEFADAGAVDIIHIREIEQDSGAAIIEQLADGFAQKSAAVAEGDFAAHVHDGDAADVAICGLECHTVRPVFPALRFLPLSFLPRSRAVAGIAAAVRFGSRGGKLFGHDDFGAAGPAADDVEFVHEGAHQKNSAARGTQQILLGERIGDVAEPEAGTFVENVDNHFVAGQIDGEMNLFFGALLVAVVEGIDDAFADGHADAIAIVFAETGGFRDTETHFLGEIHALDLAFQRHLEMLRLLRHGPLLPLRKTAEFAGDYG